MSTQVKIVYNGPVVDVDRIGTPIYRLFVPNNSYIDTPVYTNGYDNADAVGDGKSYGKSIYATNVDGWGKLPGLLPMASTTTKFAQFERAVLAAFEAKQAGTKNTGITFEVEGYEEDIYWNQMAPNMVADGFYIKVGDKEYGEAPAETEGD